MASTVADGSYVARVGVARFNLPCGEGDDKLHNLTVLSRLPDTNVSLAGHRASAVTGAVWPLK